jgi:hypothetical protein
VSEQERPRRATLAAVHPQAQARVDDQRYTLEAVLGRGLRGLGEAIDEMAARPPEEREDKYHGPNLAKCVEAVTKLKAEHRAQLEYERKNELCTDIETAVVDFLSGLDGAELTALVARARQSGK